MDEYVEIDAYEFLRGRITPVRIGVVGEYQFSLLVNGVIMNTFITMGSDLRYLTLGYLLSEGYITTASDVRGITVDESERTVSVELPEPFAPFIRPMSRSRDVDGTMESSICGKSEMLLVDAPAIIHTMKNFLQKSSLHENTRGVHGAALYDTGGRENVFFDEIGRHNALDKAIGYAAVHELSPEDTMIYFTGRMPGEIVQKVALSPLCMIVSKAMPTSLGIEIAREAGITMIGCVSGDRFIIFNGHENMVCSDPA